MREAHKGASRPTVADRWTKRFWYALSLVGLALAAWALLTDTLYEPLTSFNRGAEEAGTPVVDGVRLESADAVRDFFGVADGKIRDYDVLPADWDWALQPPADEVGVALCPAAAACDSGHPAAVDFRLCHVAHSDLGGAGDFFNFVFVPRPCLRPPGRNKLKVIYRIHVKGAHSAGLVYGPTNHGVDVKDNKVAHLVDLSDSPLVEGVLEHVGHTGALVWAREWGVDTSTESASFQDRASPVPRRYSAAITGALLALFGLFAARGDFAAQRRNLHTLARVVYRPLLVCALAGIGVDLLLPDRATGRFFEICAQVIPVVIVAISLQTSSVWRKRSLEFLWWTRPDMERVARLRLYWNAAAAFALALLVVAELECLRAIAKGGRADPGFVALALTLGLLAIVYSGYTGDRLAREVSGSEGADGLGVTTSTAF